MVDCFHKYGIILSSRNLLKRYVHVSNSTCFDVLIAEEICSGHFATFCSCYVWFIRARCTGIVMRLNINVYN